MRSFLFCLTLALCFRIADANAGACFSSNHKICGEQPLFASISTIVDQAEALAESGETEAATRLLRGAAAIPFPEETPYHLATVGEAISIAMIKAGGAEDAKTYLATLFPKLVSHARDGGRASGIVSAGNDLAGQLFRLDEAEAIGWVLHLTTLTSTSRDKFGKPAEPQVHALTYAGTWLAVRGYRRLAKHRFEAALKLGRALDPYVPSLPGGALEPARFRALSTLYEHMFYAKMPDLSAPLLDELSTLLDQDYPSDKDVRERFQKLKR